MSKFSSDDLEHLKKLCRIECTPAEEDALLHSLQRVLGYMESLKDVDTTNVAACNYVLRGMLRNPMREDVVHDALSREQFLGNAPDQIGGMVRVPPVLKAP